MLADVARISSPVSLTPMMWPAPMRVATSLTVVHGRWFGATAFDRGLGDQRVRLAVAVDDHDRPGLRARPASRTASEIGVPEWTAIARRARVRTWRAGSLRRSRACISDAVEPIHRNQPTAPR